MDRLQNKYTNCKGIKSNSNFGQVTRILEKLDTTCKYKYIICSDMQASTGFGKCVRSSGRFRCVCELHKNSRVVYHMI